MILKGEPGTMNVPVTTLPLAAVAQRMTARIAAADDDLKPRGNIYGQP